MRLRRMHVGGIALEIAEAGDGGRPLLLVHGFTGAKEDFTDFLDPLAERGFHAVAPDLRGHGESDHPSGVESYSFELFAADLLALADRLGWHRFVVLGHSMGGMVVQELAVARPERIEALILMDTAHGPLEWLEEQTLELAATVIREQGVAHLVELSNRLRDSDPLLTPSFVRLLEERPGYAEFLDRKALATSADMRLAMMPAFLAQQDRLDRLGALQVPTLVLAGEQDAGFVEHSRRMADVVPGARLVVIPESGHSPQFENPDAWWAAVSGFLDSL